MVRPITPTKPPVQPQKVNATTNAEQVARLEAQAAELREQIRLANRMGERDWATQARQELTQVNTQLNSLQQPPAAPSVTTVNAANNNTTGSGPSVTPALYIRPELAGPTVTQVRTDDGTPEQPRPEVTTAQNIVSDVTGGKSIDQIATDRGMTRDQVLAALRSGGMTVSTAESEVGVATEITDATGRTVTEHYDYEHGNYYAEIQDTPNGAATTTPIRDGLGRKETTSYNSETGAITTRYEDDLGNGTITERTSLPNRTTIETVTPAGGPALPVTTVTGPNGQDVVLDVSQDPGGATTQGIQDDLADGKSIDQIAQERGLTSEQVIAELQAAGYEVTTRGPTSDNGDVQSTEIVDPNTGDKTVYYHDYQHDERTVVTTADGTETTVSEDGNGRTRNSERNLETGETTTTIIDPKAGTETKIVIDKDGRITKTTTEEINGGEPVEYEVQQGDNLTLIAQQYGVSLDDLRESNPELFNAPRDPDIIHPGETVTIENGTRTTVEVTFNGYTLTTKPDGSLTLHNNSTGSDLQIKAGSTQEALAQTLLAVNPNSSDPAEAKEGEVVKAFVEGMLAGETLPSLIEAAEQAGVDKQALLDQYGPGIVATPTLDGQNRVVDPFGEPPQGKAPSGGNWVPMKVDGVWTWVDPQVAQAIITENIALSRVTETRALAGQGMAQFNVYMLDPAYADAVEGAQTIVNDALAPHGLQWTPEKPEGTLADAQGVLTKANTLLENAQDARGEYENADRVLKNAISQQSQLTPIIDPNADVASAQGQPAPNRQTEYAEGVAEHAAVDALFSEVGLHLSKGDKLTIDFLVGQAELDGVPTDSKEYQDLKALQETAGNQLELAEAYQNYFDAHATATEIGAQQTDLEQQLLGEYNSKNQFLFEQGKKHSRINGDYLGLFQSQELQVRDGQLWVVNHFEEGTTEQQLTYSLSEENVRDEYRDRQLNKDWQELLAGYDADAPVCTANGLQAVKAAEASAAQNLNDVLDRQLGESIEDLTNKLPTLQTNFDNLLEEHGPGSVNAPDGTLPDGVEPVKIDVGGQTIEVAPEVAEQYNQIGIDALTQSGKAVWIDLDTTDEDTSGRWVAPELAVAKLTLDVTQQQKTQAEELRRLVQGFSDYHEMRLSDPSLMADRNGSIDKSYLDEHEQETLDGLFQPKFQQLLANGYDSEFHEQRGTALDDKVATTLNIDRSTDEGRDALDNITEEIRDIGGDNPYVRLVPLFYVDDEVGTQQVTLFAVRDGDGNTRYVDVTGKSFDDLGDFQDNNNQFGEDGKLVAPKGLEMKAGDDGRLELEVVQSRNVSVWDKVVDPLVGIGTGIATILSFTPAAPVAAPLAYTGAAYLGTRAVINQVNHLEHGGEWGDTESLMNIASVATTVLPMASSGLRTIGMAGKELTALQAFRGSLGATRSGSAISLETRAYMQSSAGLNKAAWGMDVGSVIVGAPLLATSGYDLLANWDHMTDLQRANALTGFFTGVTGTGLGIHGLRTLRPGTGDNTAPGSGGPHQQPPWSDGNGPRQSPPALEAGPSGRPMNVHEMGADGVYRPTGEQVFHDPSHPVIPGEVINSRDTGGEGPAMLTGRDLDGSTSRDETGPADGDPIVVPERPTIKEDSIRLVWNPETRSFTGTPEHDTGGYTYTSGKDPRTPSAYLEKDSDGNYRLLSSQVGSRRSGPMQIRDENGQFVTATRYGPLPKSAENVYVPPADGPQARGDEPELMHKSHIFYRDPETGEAYVLPWTRGASQDHVPGGTGRPEGEATPLPALPEQKAIEAAPPTTYSLQQVRNMRQPEKWKAGEVYTRELNGSTGEAHFPVDANPNGPHPVLGEGGRYVDAPVFKSQDVIEAIEVKTYHRWTTIDGTAEMREVPLTSKLQQQINKDVALHNENPGYQPRWVFLDAPPSAELQRALDDAGIIGNIFGHNKPAAAKPAVTQSGSGRTLQLTDRNGEVIVAAMLGTEPRSPEQVYIPPTDGPRAPADAPEVADKTHILVYDPNTGEAVVLPWIRGASEDHVSGSLGRPEEGSQPIEATADPTRPMRGNVGPFVFRADTRTPAQIRDAGGFSPPPPTGIWVNNTQGITLSNYVMGNTHGRFVGTSQSVSGAKTFVAEESRAARDQGHTYLYVLNPGRPRLHVPTEFEAMGRPVSDRMARVDETAVDGTVPWSEVHGWRMMDPDGNFIGEFTRNPDAIAPGASTPRRPQVILRPADEFWDVSAPVETDASTPPVTEETGNGAPAVVSETPQVANVAAETPPAATWPPAPDRGRAVFDATTGTIVSLELPRSFAAEPGRAEPVRAPTGKEVNALSADEMSGLTVAELHAIRPEHIAKLTTDQIAALSPEQVGQLTFDQLAALRPKQLRALSAEQLQAIRPSRLQAIAPGRITTFTPDQVAAFSPEQLAALTTEQVRKLTPDQIANLSDEQRNAFTEEQFAAMRPAQFSHLDGPQFAAFKPELVAARDSVTMAKLSEDHISALTREQLGALTVQQIEALTKPQVQALTPTQLGELSPGQLRKFTPKQFAWMTTEQTNALSVVQLTTYRVTHKATMTPDQGAAVDAALTHARIKENTQLVATFGPMAGSSYTIWQMLPPHWAATAAGIAFGVRGVVFSAQSVFPNATASHKPLGRALNAASGASFIFSSPGSTAGMLRGENLVVNGTFALGNVIYGPKSVLQSFTGRPVFRIMADHVGNAGYLVGSAAYTVQNLHSPLAASAGVLFTVGSAEFWASAIRTDRLNRQSIPRTDEDVGARANSDKRWGYADRIALGITFGVGMLLFAWDALDDQPWNVASPNPDSDPTTPGDDASGVDNTPPDDGADEPDPGTQEPAEDFPQLVVLADDGLNLRTQPDQGSTAVTVLQPGTFVEQTAGPSTDQAGESWIPVEGYGPDGKMHAGWVSADFVGVHPEGSSNAEGRTNPKLEESGYRWVEVREGDSIRLIAASHSADVAETVVLNMDHIVSPDMIFSGDRIYLPVIAVG